VSGLQRPLPPLMCSGGISSNETGCKDKRFRWDGWFFDVLLHRWEVCLVDLAVGLVDGCLGYRQQGCVTDVVKPDNSNERWHLDPELRERLQHLGWCEVAVANDGVTQSSGLQATK